VPLVGGYRTGAAPLGAFTLWLHRSAPLDALVREMLVNSNNHTAETLLRVLGESGGRAGTDAAGVAFEKRELARLDVSRERMRLYDGSGLAPSDRIMPETLAQLIAKVSRGPYGDVFVRSLPRVGLEGTVRHHELRDALGRTRAKSGHIEGVNGLAGTIATRHHGRIAFAFIVNDPRANADVVYTSEDRALDALSDF
jgi:D-alanyl-D-alanine carboxypeptidase/D-alanyl-D-alanine-endopeptidase (penicillin-binding protein 4)